MITSDPDRKSYKGIGIASHFYSKNLKADVLAGVDKTPGNGYKLLIIKDFKIFQNHLAFTI